MGDNTATTEKWRAIFWVALDRLARPLISILFLLHSSSLLMLPYLMIAPDRLDRRATHLEMRRAGGESYPLQVMGETWLKLKTLMRMLLH